MTAELEVTTRPRYTLGGIGEILDNKFNRSAQFLFLSSEEVKEWVNRLNAGTAHDHELYWRRNR